ncbi:MAG TPA: RNA-binding domain-containing protein [Chloroflexia bacterium]|nr:RNA-binding domain-containing protein [Chloroflexia bacterium]
MIRRPYSRGGGARRTPNTGRTWRESGPDVVEADREAARTRTLDGMKWIKMDLHIHTPASSDYRDPGISYLDILKKAEEKGLDIMAFADHNSVGGYAAMHREIETLTLLERLGRMTDTERITLNEYRRLLGKIVVLPAFEFTATFGFHILGVFPENTSIRKLEYLLLNLNVPEEKMVMGAPDAGSTSDVLAAYAAISAAGGLAIAAHANSSNGVAMQGFPFGGQTKIAYTQDHNLVALEVTDLEGTGRRNTASFYNGSKTEYPRRMHCIQGSDAHSVETEQSDSNNKRLGVGARITEILARDASFASLKEVLTSTDFTRTRPHRANWLWDLVEAARIQGPNIAQSFHERALTHTSRTRPILHDVVAFANTTGGTVYVGANPDTRIPLHGLDRTEDDVRLLKQDIQQTIYPAADVEFDVRENGPRGIIVINVPKGSDQPYIFTPTGQIYIRERANTRLASRDEIVNLVLSSAGVKGPKPTTASAGEPMSPTQLIERAVPVPTQPAQARTRPWREERREPQQPTPQPPQPTTQTSASNPKSEMAVRTNPKPVPAHLANLPPEKIKGRIQPMLSPGDIISASEGAEMEEIVAGGGWPQLGAAHEEEGDYSALVAVGMSVASTPSEATTDADITQPTEVASEPEQFKPKRSTRGRPRKGAKAEAETVPEPETLTPQSAALDTPMEATVSAEHLTREEIVTEAAETVEAKPKRGRRRSQRDKQMEIEAPTAASAESEAGAEAILVAAEIEPGPQMPGEVADDGRRTTDDGAQPADTQQPAPKKGRSRRKTSAQETGEQQPATAEPQAEAPTPQPEETTTKPKRATSKKSKGESTKSKNQGPKSKIQPPPDPPRTGVEIIEVEPRNGVNYHTMQDLRNFQKVHNVTRKSARRLWHYAIVQHDHGAPALSEVLWHAEAPIGLWRQSARAGATRYDLVSRQTDGSLRIFYGVTSDGLHAEWVELIKQAEEAGYQGPEPAEGQ